MQLRELIFAPFAVLLGCGCSDRTVVDDPDADEEREACEAMIEWAHSCGFEGSVDKCLFDYFSDRLAPCRDVALNRTRCFPEHTCEEEVICQDEVNAYSVCSADPEIWEELGCDASKCPGECCRGHEPCRYDPDCPWYKPVCNDQTGLCMEAP